MIKIKDTPTKYPGNFPPPNAILQYMITRIQTSTIVGIDAHPIEVEVKTWEEQGERYFNIVGLGDNAVREAKERVRSALTSSKFYVPKGILVNLSPAELRKAGSAFDLPIAIGILISSGQLKCDLQNKHFIGELGLDGRLNSVKGAVIIAIEIEKQNRKKDKLLQHELVLPESDLLQTKLVPEVKKHGATTLTEVVSFLKKECVLSSDPKNFLETTSHESELIEVKGQEHAKKALMIAAAGGHNLLMIGPPGCGKSLLAKNFINLLPKLTFEEKLDVIKIYSILGLSVTDILHSKRPFRSPHHSASIAGIVGGGSPPRPGEISLAHRGVLFFDEIPEFPRPVLEALRAPLEDGTVQVVRARETHKFPASFQFLAAMNPCPCGKYGLTATQCGCSVFMINNYVNRISQPIRDRIDMHLQLNPIPIKELITTNKTSTTQKIKEAVFAAYNRQIERQSKLNSQLTHNEILELVAPDSETVTYLDSVATRFGISARGCIKILKMAQTIVDIRSCTKNAANSKLKAGINEIKEAVGYRVLERYKI